MRLGIDSRHFGIMIVTDVEVGMCHPPVRLNLYVAPSIARMSIAELTIAVMPWFLTTPGFLVLVTYAPQLSLQLPSLIFQ